MNFPIWMQFLNLGYKTPVLLRKIAYLELNTIQRMTSRMKVNNSGNPTKVSYLVH